MKLRVLLLAGLCVVGGQARAGLFNDDIARQQIEQLGTRVSGMEDAAKQQVESNKQQSATLLDLQSQIQSLNADLRTLRGQNEELVHNLQDLDKRQKDFYIDLDTRLRHFESTPAAAPVPTPVSPAEASVVPVATDDPAVENRAYEAAYSLYKAGKFQDAIVAFQDFLKKFPESVYVPNAHYEIGAAYFVLNDYKKSEASYLTVLSKYAYSPKAPEAMLGVADCKRGLKAITSATKVLKQLIAKYPESAAASEAKKRLEKHK